MKRVSAVGALVGVVAVLSGSAFPPGACTTIGWSNAVEIDPSAYGSDVFLQVCTDAGCSTGPGVEPTPSTDLSVPERGDAGAFGFGFDAPDHIIVRVYDDGGILLSETEEPIDWTHSTDPCGGPSTAPPVVLER
ncbi:hypothetical protein [Microbacterium sp. GCS4]|uniref:hypothetical protein n=1 Tax=Microbacterium sp. GCS4 TaxID=1692239 RepID=UPI0006801C13|nr:hypothetical protein [Microbacterium sp. GCS4]KNY06415.1 hypothetical protein AKH00_11710 [Microbacterium sp. GCS4]